jgi:hypothetical protein
MPLYQTHGMLTIRPVSSFLTSTRWIRSTLSHSVSLNIYLKIFPSMHRSSQWSVSHSFAHQNPVHTCPLPTCTTGHTVSSSSMWSTEHYKSWKLLISQPPILGTDIFLSTLPCDTFNLHSSLQVTDLFHTHWTTHNITILCISVTRLQMTRKQVQNQQEANISWSESAVNFFVNEILTASCRCQVF